VKFWCFRHLCTGDWETKTEKFVSLKLLKVNQNLTCWFRLTFDSQNCPQIFIYRLCRLWRTLQQGYKAARQLDSYRTLLIRINLVSLLREWRIALIGGWGGGGEKADMNCVPDQPMCPWNFRLSFSSHVFIFSAESSPNHPPLYYSFNYVMTLNI
jgi:hypothetical protein